MNKKRQSKSDLYRIKVLHKAFRLLDLFSSEEVEELAAPEITEKLGYTQPTVFRIISNLEEEGYLEKNLETGKYRLGMRLFFLGNRVKPYHFLKNAARPLLIKLNHQIGETVHLAVLHKYEVLYIDKIHSAHTVRVVISQVGKKLPAHCSGVGKVLLAHLPMDEVKEAVEEAGLPAFTANTITTWNRLKEELEKIRQQGFGLDDEEIEIGLKCVAAPVFIDQQVVGALSVSIPKLRFDQAGPDLPQVVMSTAQELSAVLQEYSLNHKRPGRQWPDVNHRLELEIEPGGSEG